MQSIDADAGPQEYSERHELAEARRDLPPPGQVEVESVTRYQRRIDYLRLSITDRCNLRCVYCMPPHGVPFIPHDDILRYEEIERLARLAVSLGITKIRLTGGEPLVRRGVLHLCERLAQIAGGSESEHHYQWRAFAGVRQRSL